MTIHRSGLRALTASALALAVSLTAALYAEEAPPPAAEQQATPAPAADPTSAPAPQEAAAPVPAEPIATAVPVMPATLVTPSGVQGEVRPAPAVSPPKVPTRPRAVALGDHGVIELGRPANAKSRWRGAPISLSLRDAPLEEVLRSFARLAGVNLVLDPRVRGTVTVELRDVPWDQALHVILKSQGLGAEIDGKVWLVEP